jgi:hypothetical protein
MNIDADFFHKIDSALTPELIVELHKLIPKSDTSSVRKLSRLLKHPNYIGRLLITSKITGVFINPLDGTSRQAKKYEIIDIEGRLNKLNHTQRESALAVLKSYSGVSNDKP